jgi:hypothetical protein
VVINTIKEEKQTCIVCIIEGEVVDVSRKPQPSSLLCYVIPGRSVVIGFIRFSVSVETALLLPFRQVLT